MRFNIDDVVTWTSQANAGYKRKTGKIVAIVPAGSWPYDIIESERLSDFNCSPIDNRSLPRNHQSYLVSIDNGRAKSKLYWPRVSALSRERIKQCLN